ncbi:MAG: hypothetical protein GY711_01790 [bacterium]|nr:hypothetical protein [bacterium]
MMSIPDGRWAFPITEADLLSPTTVNSMPMLGPIPPSSIEVSGGVFPPPGLALALHPGCVGHPPGFPCGVEVDAMSYGQDWFLDPTVGLMPGGNIFFSVDGMAQGIGTPYLPDLTLEASTAEASSDVYVDIGLVHGVQPPFPGGLPPFAITPSALLAVDGDGLRSAVGALSPGVGLFEGPGGDNLDALDVHSLPFNPVVYFSLDSAFLDPTRGVPNSASAAAHGVVGGDVLVNPFPGAPFGVYAPALALGLDLFGPDTDDVDALILWESGDGVFTPSLTPYDWTTGLGIDMLLFSVRRGSAVIGVPDSLLGIPIEEGDILTTPIGGGGPPVIFIAAENFGLRTVRGGFGFGDDLVAADSSNSPLMDCNGNQVEDAVDIALGFATDVNADGVPDSCQLLASPYCFGFACPCANNSVFAGCINNTGGGGLLFAQGSSVHPADDLVLTTVGVPANNFGYYFMGGSQFTPPLAIQNGMVCVSAGALGLYRWPVQTSGPAGVISMGPGIVAQSAVNFGPPGTINPGFTWNFQCWYRDPAGPCGANSNYSNAMSVLFLP